MSGLTVKYLGVDWGQKRIGLALGDNEAKVAVPFDIVENFQDILDIIKSEDIDCIILGEPTKMKGKQIALQKEYLDFAKKLKKQVQIPVKTVDERLSSKMADSLRGGKKVSRADRDALAAMVILQSFLDKE